MFSVTFPSVKPFHFFPCIYYPIVIHLPFLMDIQVINDHCHSRLLNLNGNIYLDHLLFTNQISFELIRLLVRRSWDLLLPGGFGSSTLGCDTSKTTATAVPVPLPPLPYLTTTILHTSNVCSKPTTAATLSLGTMVHHW
jgi:hypothetical protein